MPDLESTRLGFYNSGLSAGQFFGQGLNIGLRAQQQKAEQSDRAIRERMLAAQIAQTDLENQQLQADITRRAEEDAQWLQVNTDIAKRKLVFDNALEMANSGGLIKDPAAIQQPDWQGMRKQAAFELAQQGNSRAQEVVKSELAAESAMALARQREASTKLAEARTTALTQDPDDFTQRAKALGLEPSGIDAQGRTTFARPRTGETIKTNPDGTVEIIRGAGKSADSLTPTNTTRTQESLQQSLNTIETANRLEPLISSSTVGVKAFAENIVLDKVLSQAFPELASKDRAEATVLAARMRSSTIAELKSDGNITEKERNQILQAVPEVNDPLDSPQNALNVIRATRRMAAISALVKAQKLGAQIPSQAVQALSVPDLVNAARSGVISEKTALEAFRMRPK